MAIHTTVDENGMKWVRIMRRGDKVILICTLILVILCVRLILTGRL